MRNVTWGARPHEDETQVGAYPLARITPDGDQAHEGKLDYRLYAVGTIA
jgi:hypothetical protein